MSKHLELRFAGSGGQGVILCSIILAEAGFLAGKQVAQSQAYGPEARGGSCRAELVVDDTRISFPKVERPDFLLALTQASFEKFAVDVDDKTLILIDSSLTVPKELRSRNIMMLPILKTASEVVGRAMTANIVAVGAVNALYNIAPDDVLEEAVLKRIPKGTEELNLKALKEGKRLVEER